VEPLSSKRKFERAKRNRNFGTFISGRQHLLRRKPQTLIGDPTPLAIYDHGLGVGFTSANEGTRHADHVYSVVETANPLPEEFSTSWAPSIREHGLDPAGEPVPRVLAPVELKEVLEPKTSLRGAHSRRAQ
jgi:hypothetical protein